MISNSILYVAIGFFALFFALLIFVRQIDGQVNELREENKSLHDKIDMFDRELSVVGETLFNKTVDNKKRLDRLENVEEATSHLKGIEASLRGLFDIVEQAYKNGSSWCSGAFKGQTEYFRAYDFEGEARQTEEQAEAVDHGKKTADPCYRWIFPSDDDWDGEWPVTMDEYLVIGRDKESGEMVSGVCVWRGSHWLDMENDRKLDWTYAYIRLPSPSDVMEKVIDIRLKDQ